MTETVTSVNEGPTGICACGHLGGGPGSDHDGLLGHGGCFLCPCRKYTWVLQIPKEAQDVFRGREPMYIRQEAEEDLKYETEALVDRIKELETEIRDLKLQIRKMGELDAVQLEDALTKTKDQYMRLAIELATAQQTISEYMGPWAEKAKST